MSSRGHTKAARAIANKNAGHSLIGQRLTTVNGVMEYDVRSNEPERVEKRNGAVRECWFDERHLKVCNSTEEGPLTSCGDCSSLSRSGPIAVKCGSTWQGSRGRMSLRMSWPGAASDKIPQPNDGAWSLYLHARKQNSSSIVQCCRATLRAIGGLHIV